MESEVRVSYARGKLTCDYLAWGELSSSLHWRICYHTGSGIECFTKGFFRGERWVETALESVPGPVWRKVREALSNLRDDCYIVSLTGLAQEAERLGEKDESQPSGDAGSGAESLSLP